MESENARPEKAIMGLIRAAAILAIDTVHVDVVPRANELKCLGMPKVFNPPGINMAAV